MQAVSILNHAMPGAIMPGLLPRTMASQEPLESVPLWQLLVRLLPDRDPRTEWYQVADIAPLVGLKPRGVLKHARNLWPRWEGQYRLNREQAEILIRRISYAGRKLPTRETVLAMLAARGGDRQ